MTFSAKDVARFEAFVYPEPNSGCHLWAGASNCLPEDYGRFAIGSRTDGTRRRILAHHFAWLVAGRDLPAGLFLLHKCDVPSCVNVDHLRVGNALENARDAMRRGRLRHGVGVLPYGVVARATADRKRRFRASIRSNCKQICLGTFNTAEEAAAVAMAARQRVLNAQPIEETA